MIQLRRLFLFCCWLALTTGLQAQTSSTDSLKELYTNKYKGFFRGSTDSFLHYQNLLLELQEQTQDWEGIVMCYNYRTNHYYRKRDYIGFQNTCAEAVRIGEKQLDAESSAYRIAIGNYGMVSKMKGDYKQALSNYQKALELHEKNQSAIVDRATTVQNIGSLFREKGDFQQAIAYTKRTYQLYLEVPGNGEDHYLTVYALSQLGHTYRDKKEYDRAKKIYHQFIDIVSSTSYPENTYTLRGKIYVNQGMSKIFIEEQQTDSALYYIQQALALQTKPKAFRKIQSYEILGEVYLQRKQYAEALDVYEKGIALAEQNYAAYEKHPIKAAAHRRAADALLQTKQADKALAYYQKALIKLTFDFADSTLTSIPASEQMFSKKEGVEILKGKADAYWQKYKNDEGVEFLKQSFKHFGQAAQLIQDLRQSFLKSKSKLLLAELSLDIHEGAVRTAIELGELTGDQNYLEQALTYTERNKAMVLLESLQQGDALQGAQISEEDLEQERLLRLDIAFYEKQINREKQKKEKANAKKLKEWETALFDFRTSYDELIAEFEQKYPLYHKLKYDIQTIGLADIRTQLLDDRTAILEYFIGQQNSYLFYVSRTDFKVYPLDRGKVQEEAIRELRGIVGQIPEEKSFLAECGRFNELSAGLYQQLLQPALSAVPESVDRLVLVPDNYLSLLPFGLLIRTQLSENPGNYRLSTFDYLLEDFAISYNYSLTLLSYTQNQILDSGADDFVGFAPVFGKQAAGGRMASRSCFDGELYDLVCNRQEVDYIHQLYGGQAVLAENANKEAFQLVAPQGRILHLATHACADEENIDQSRIHFSNGYITSQELQGMDLKADLAVLSACNTGSGRLIKGEGVMSLSRSFLLAGCASTLVSLWSVDDCATSDVMKYFYTSLSNDLGKDQALREATLQYLAQADKVGSHPYYWGAFVQSGSAVALSKGTSQLLWWLAGGVLLLGLFLFLRRRGGAA